MKPGIMAEEPRYKRRKQANPRRKNVSNYENAASASSETDDETTMCSDGDGVDRDKDADGPAVGVPSLEASPHMGHALLSLKGAEVREGLRNSHQHWRLRDNITIEAQKKSCGDNNKESGRVGPESQHTGGNGSVKTLDFIHHLDDYFLKRKVEEGEGHPVSIVEYLQRSDTAIIYPEAPEEPSRLATPEGVGQDESEHELQNHTPDDFAQLLTCPYCDRGYKRVSSLKEHIKYRHEKNEESFGCSLCSEVFTSRTQLERHTSTHKASGEQLPLLNEAAANRKFKCSECGKAFKYKHHLKEHLRIHSGEKPYECSNCKKRFSHSGSYSSHISSKKCISLVAVNGRVRNINSIRPGSSPSSITSSPGSPVLSQFCHKMENGHSICFPDHQNQLDIKSEPLNLGEYCQMMSTHGFAGPDGYLNGHSPLSILSSSRDPQQHVGGCGVDLTQLTYAGSNLGEVQKVLQTVDNTICRKKRDRNPKEISMLRAYMKELGTEVEEQQPPQSSFHKGEPGNHTKSMNDCILEKVNEAKSLINESKRAVDESNEKSNTEHSGEEKPSDQLTQLLCFSCQFCKEMFSGPIPLHQHERYLCKMNEEIKAVLQPAENSPAQHLSNSEGVTSAKRSLKDVSLLRTCFDINAEPNTEDLQKISVAVGLPEDFISEWFSQWKRQNCQGGGLRIKLPHPENCGADTSTGQSPVSVPAAQLQGHFTKKRPFQNHRPSARAKPQEREAHMRSSTPSPLNLSSTPNESWSCLTSSCQASEDARGDSPLDLSLPKPHFNGFIREKDGDAQQREHPPGPSDLINIKSEVLATESGANLVSQLDRSTSPIFGMNPFAGCHLYASLPHEALAPATFMSPARATITGFRPYASLDPMSFLPHMAYSYATGATTYAEMQHGGMYQRKAGLQGELLDGKPDYLSGLDDLTDSDSLLCRKKMKKTESGKRPHQCEICKKAFKHKHHLIEHSRLHSGEKPYQCDKCGKRFSHSGSYSQHMNHRYSYCKREAEEREEAQREGSRRGGGLQPAGPLMRRTYLQELDPLGYSDPDEQQGDVGGRCTVLSVSSVERKMEGDRKTEEEVEDVHGEVSEKEKKQEQEGTGSSRKDLTTPSEVPQ
ncbi:zinc finger E-box-binding homeobox 2a isoform X2 [Takifugu rubripes]|uniref:Zinc finger E-box binding homeobox 2a n=1 Tax=Takifugu rubripes TaxID=31033 RepID=A0A674MIX6_TAKRU|nr:zinc finger E-box-binding homeobox 2-like isoform X2 [Takifugu rubripes]